MLAAKAAAEAGRRAAASDAGESGAPLLAAPALARSAPAADTARPPPLPLDRAATRFG
jgi:hypothetical protein